MLKEKLEKALMNACDSFFALPNYAAYDYFGVLCALELDSSCSKFNMNIESAAVLDSSKEELTEDDILELSEKEVIENVDLEEFEQLLIDSSVAYENKIFFIIPEIISWLDFENEEPTLGATLDALNDYYAKRAAGLKGSIIGFRIEIRVF